MQFITYKQSKIYFMKEIQTIFNISSPHKKKVLKNLFTFTYF